MPGWLVVFLQNVLDKLEELRQLGGFERTLVVGLPPPEMEEARQSFSVEGNPAKPSERKSSLSRKFGYDIDSTISESPFRRQSTALVP